MLSHGIVRLIPAVALPLADTARRSRRPVTPGCAHETVLRRAVVDNAVRIVCAARYPSHPIRLSGATLAFAASLRLT